MSEPWPAAVANICGLARIGTIVHIGAGEGAELAGYLATGAHRIALVEPNPELLPGLERAAAGDDRVRILPVAVSARAGLSPLNLFNFSALSSLRAPTGLHELFPGLRKSGEPEVETLPLADVLQQAEIDAAATNILVIDAPGEERQIVTDLIGSAWATQFSRIVLHAAIAPIYEGAAPVAELVDLLEEHGYRVSGQRGDDPDFPEVHFRLEPIVVENRRLAEALERADSNAREEAAARAASELRAQSAEHKVAELEQERCELVAEIEQQRLAHQEERKKLSGQTGTVNELRRRIAELEEALAEGESRRQAIAEEITRAEAQMEIVRELMVEAGGNRRGARDTLRRNAG